MTNLRNYSSLLFISLIIASSLTIEALDITKILQKYPDFSSFSQKLTETKLADQINSRQTITVLALDNAAVSAIAGKPSAAVKAILSTHIVLDYFDEQKLLTAVNAQQTKLTTLYQTTGAAGNGQGFLKVGDVGEGEIAFGSAVNGAPLNANLVKTVMTEPYNISIIQVSEAIVAPGIGAGSPQSSPSSSSSTASPTSTPESEAPVASRKTKSPASSPVEAESPEEAEITAIGDAPASAPAAADDAAAADHSGSSSRVTLGFVWATVMGLGAIAF